MQTVQYKYDMDNIIMKFGKKNYEIIKIINNINEKLSQLEHKKCLDKIHEYDKIISDNKIEIENNNKIIKEFEENYEKMIKEALKLWNVI